MKPDASIDISALCREAGVPADDAGAHRLARLVALQCAAVCESFEPDGDAEHVPRNLAREVGGEIGVQLRALFSTDELGLR